MSDGELWLQRLQQSAGLTSNSVVCEIGCGSGDRGEVVYGHCQHWFGADEPFDAWQRGVARLGGRPRVSFLKLSSDRPLDLPDACIDILYTTCAPADFEHYRIGPESVRLLQPNGRLIWAPPSSDREAWPARLRRLGFVSAEWVAPESGKRSDLLVARVSDGVASIGSRRPIAPRCAGAVTHLGGVGLEIGHFADRLPLQADCHVRYLDLTLPQTTIADSRDGVTELVEVHRRGDLLELDFDRVATAELDFVICNTVLRRLHGRSRTLESLFRVVRVGGHVLMIEDLDFGSNSTQRDIEDEIGSISASRGGVGARRLMDWRDSGGATEWFSLWLRE